MLGFWVERRGESGALNARCHLLEQLHAWEGPFQHVGVAVIAVGVGNSTIMAILHALLSLCFASWVFWASEMSMSFCIWYNRSP